MKNIVLIGISGSGKTTLGKVLAERLDREFIDLDSIIQKKENLTIREIFELHGEEGFRQRETEAVKTAVRRSGSVIACGGGVVTKEVNMQLLSANGIIIFIDRPLKEILHTADLEDRPLLKGGPEKLYSLYAERLDLYKKYADFKVGRSGDSEKTLQEMIRIAAMQGKDKRYAVIGDPVGHSLSQDIHLSVLGYFWRSVQYEKIRVPQKQLQEWIREARVTEIDGFNVTMPHKEAIIPLLDGIDAEAAMYRAVNTVVNENGMLWGYNTDGEGFVRALAGIRETFKEKKVTILGAGGAARTIALKAAREGASYLRVLARDPVKARALCLEAEHFFEPGCCSYGSMDPENMHEEWRSHILIHATPLGMKGMHEEFQAFTFLDHMRKDALLCDLIYSPMKTKLLQEGRKRGLRTLGGIHMLIHQALAADRLYLKAELNRNKAYIRVVDSLIGKAAEL